MFGDDEDDVEDNDSGEDVVRLWRTVVMTDCDI